MKKLFTLFVVLMVFFIASPAFADATAIGTGIAGADAAVTQNFEAAENLRPFTNSGNVNFAPIPSFFGPDTPGPTYQRVELILPLKSEWQRSELEPTIEDTDIMFRCRYFLKTRDVLSKDAKKALKTCLDSQESGYLTEIEILERKATDTIHVITVPPQGKFKMIGHITVWSEDKYTTSLELMAKTMLLAIELPTTNALLITGQGCEKKVETSGWSIFGNQTRATINSAQNVSGLSVGGMGYSSGTAGNTGRPWLQAAIIQFAQ